VPCSDFRPRVPFRQDGDETSCAAGVDNDDPLYAVSAAAPFLTPYPRTAGFCPAGKACNADADAGTGSCVQLCAPGGPTVCTGGDTCNAAGDGSWGFCGP
jgi:hypothetical protein